jgi:hypothetical protein
MTGCIVIGILILIVGAIVVWKLIEICHLPAFQHGLENNETNSVTMWFATNVITAMAAGSVHAQGYAPLVPAATAVTFQFQYGISDGKGFATMEFPDHLDLTSEPGSIAVVFESAAGPIEYTWDAINGDQLWSVTNQVVAVISRSTDLQNWQPIATNTVTEESVNTYTDTNAPEQQAFYRVDKQ